MMDLVSYFFFQAEDGIRDGHVTGVQTCALPISQMKSVGEAMGIGRTFTEAFLKAARSRELDTDLPAELPAGAHPWFARQLERAKSTLCSTRTKSDLVANDWIKLKSTGWSDADLASAWNTSEEEVRQARLSWGIRPSYRRVDSCAAEVEA